MNSIFKTEAPKITINGHEIGKPINFDFELSNPNPKRKLKADKYTVICKLKNFPDIKVWLKELRFEAVCIAKKEIYNQRSNEFWERFCK